MTKKRKRRRTTNRKASDDSGGAPVAAAAAAVDVADDAAAANGGKKKKKTETTAARSTTEKNSDASIDGDNLDTNNPLLREQSQFLTGLSRTERESFFSDSAVDPSRRAEIWERQADLGERLVDRYSWATPNAAAIRVLRRFGPIVEVGCGKNAYWCRLMQRAGIDVAGYDADPDAGGTIGKSHAKQTKQESSSKKRKKSDHDKQFRVRKGGPEVLTLPENQGRTLFLCYPDENDFATVAAEQQAMDEGAPSQSISLGSACLEHYRGEFVVHVGELAFLDATLATDQAPWGRSSSPDFQEQLAAQFHCVLRMRLPGWLHARDSLSVWKRSETCQLVFAAEDSDDEDEVVEYR